MVEILEGVFEPGDLGESHRHVHAEFEEGVAEADRHAAFGGEPADAHDVGDRAMDVEDVGRTRFHQEALAGGVEIFAGVDQRPRRALAEEPQAVEIGAENRILDPEEIVSGTPDRLEPGQRLLGAPGLVGIDHDAGAAAHGLAEEIQAMQVALEVGVADLDLEGGVADRVGVPEQLDEGVVGEMEVEPAGIGGDAIAAAAEVAPEGKAHFLGGEVPQRLLQGFVEGQREAALVAAARTADAVDERRRRLAVEAAPSLAQEHALDLGLVGQRHEQSLDEAEPDLAGVGDQLERRQIDVVGAHLAVADHPVAGELEAGKAELGVCALRSDRLI